MNRNQKKTNKHTNHHHQDQQITHTQNKETNITNTTTTTTTTTTTSATEPTTTLTTTSDDNNNNNNNNHTTNDDNKHIKQKFGPFQPSKFTPKTEIHEVVTQFDDMVSNFSGSSVAQSINLEIQEVKNEFSLIQQFKPLYFSRNFIVHGVPPGRQQTKDLLEGQRVTFPYEFTNNHDTFPTSEQEQNNYLKQKHLGPISRVPDVHDDNHDDEDQNNGNDNDNNNDNNNCTRNKKNTNKEKRSSSLFFWILILMVLPFLLTTVSISTVVITRTSKEIAKFIHDTKGVFIDMEKNALSIYVFHRAKLLSSLMERPIRDLHVLTRYSGWLLFNAVKRADSFTEIRSNVEPCKTYTIETMQQCPQQQRVCDCAWGDRRGTCTNYSTTTDFRMLQRPFFVSQSQDVWPNGDRNFTSFPNVAYSPETTSWYDDVTSLPGHEHGSLVLGYNTTYARIRSLSALPIYEVLYNQDIVRNDRNKEKVHLATYVAYEADGTFLGYEGCAYPGHVARSHNKLTSKNELFRPDFCRAGKYGYDPRCRAWYNDMKHLYEIANATLYVTPPYRFAADNNFYGQTCVAPLIDSTTGEFIAQTLVDFSANPFLEYLNQKQTSLRADGFPILISAANNIILDDTVVGPNFSFSNPQPIADVIFPHHHEAEQNSNCDTSTTNTNTNNNDKQKPQPNENCQNRDKQIFQQIVDQMKVGKTGTAEFKRTIRKTKTPTVTNTAATQAEQQAEEDNINHSDDTVVVEENYYMAYAPVKTRSLRPINHSDFARGTELVENTIYSLALAESRESLLTIFDDFERDLRRQKTLALIVLILVVALASMFVVFISYRVAMSITEPMLYLLELIGQINRIDSFCDADDITVDRHRRGHSVEVINVAKTLESLYHVVGNANVAFFTGNHHESYAVLSEALRLYRRLKNKKGISIACNNLGNVMLAMYRTMEAEGEGEDHICGFTKREIVTKGVQYFHEAIQLGEKAYDAFYEMQGWSPSCLEFMQHLSNRYFNRAMFLLTVKDCHEKPKEIEELGFRDLEISRDLDLEIVEEGFQAGWGGVKMIGRRFNITLSRLRGHLRLLEMGYPDDWEVAAMLEQAFQTVKKEFLQRPDDSSLFHNISPAGRMQQIETELMRYKMVKGDVVAAAKIAIRMLVEDDYTFLDAQLKATEVLLCYIRSSEYKQQQKQQSEQENDDDDDNDQEEEHDYGEFGQPNQQQHHYDKSQLEEELLDYVDCINVDNALTYVRGRAKSSLKESLRGDFTMEIF